MIGDPIRDPVRDPIRDRTVIRSDPLQILSTPKEAELLLTLTRCHFLFISEYFRSSRLWGAAYTEERRKKKAFETNLFCA